MSLTLLLLQLAVILFVARACGLVLRAIGQPMVIGEMAAGVLLGPAAFGALWPEGHAALFPAASLASLSSLALIGVVLFMFVIGAELRAPSGVGRQLRAAGWVGISSMVLPMLLGLAIAPALHPALAPPGAPFWPFALFLGVALSITAFPVLARILKDRGMTQTGVGQLALGAAGIVDACAWVLLAVVVALAGAVGGYAGLWRPALGLVVLVAVVLLGVRPLLARLLRGRDADALSTPTILTVLVIGLFGCALLTEWLHLHAVFGAFLFGLALPRDERLLKVLLERIEPVSVVVLMPIFFALAGLGTTGDAFADTGRVALALVLGVAVVGKIVGGAAGARVCGCSWRDSLAVGTLMNARGLMELIVIKVGHDAGLIGAELFTMLLVMALVTTAATGPLLTLIERWRAEAPRDATAP